MNTNRSVATIDSPEFIDIHPYNPLISECQIKVMYVGKNRNGSYIDKNTAIQMANSLPGCPIVGYYKDEVQDFADHGQVMTIEGGEIKFSCKTVPYGFVSPDAQVWFQKFVDTDEFGQDIEREYMMTTGYLWTGQFEEAKSVIQEGKGQSMELDSDTLNGHWANDAKTEMDFFIINDALFSKLCILGDDVEPCFEGASVTAKQYSAEDSFAKSLYTMMKELQYALGQKEGGSYMPNKQDELQENETDFVVTSAGAVISESVTEEVAEEEVPEVAETATEEIAEPEPEPVKTPAHAKKAAADSEEFAKKKDEAPSDKEESDEADEAPADDSEKKDEPKKGEPEKKDDSKKEDAKADEEDAPESDEEDEDKKKKPETKHSLAEDEAIMAELAELREFKLNYERAQKDEIINKYHMLSDEDKAEVVAHKDEYTLEQIDEKLALVYVRKNVDFSTVDGRPEVQEAAEEPALLAFSLDDSNIIDNAEPVDGLHEALRELFK